jgi:hypothetical protein
MIMVLEEETDGTEVIEETDQNVIAMSAGARLQAQQTLIDMCLVKTPAL